MSISTLFVVAPLDTTASALIIVPLYSSPNMSCKVASVATILPAGTVSTTISTSPESVSSAPLVESSVEVLASTDTVGELKSSALT